MFRRTPSSPRAYLLELTPPRGLTAGPGAVENLLAALALRGGCALEIAARAGEAPRFLARAPSPEEGFHLARQLVGQYPQGAVQPVEDPADDPALLDPAEGAVACEMRLRGPAHLPLRTYCDPDAREGNDPLLGVLGALCDLPAGMRGLCQLALWPADPHWGREASRVAAPLPRERTAGPPDGTGSGESAWPLLVAGGLGLAGWKGYTLVGAADLLHKGMVIVGGLALLPPVLWAVSRLRPPAPPDPVLVREKAAHRGFVVRLRLLVAGGDAGPAGAPAREQALASLVAAYGPYDLPSGNALAAHPCPAENFVAPRPTGSRWPGAGRLALLNAREAASLWHLPTATAGVPGLYRGGSRQILAAHPGLQARPGSIPVGVSRAQGKAVPVSLPAGHLLRHTLVIGGSGTGKTTYMGHLARGVLADPACGLLLLDPHSALAPRVLGWLPPARAASAVAVSLAETERPVGLNLLDAHGGRTLSQVEEGLIAGFKYHWDGSWGARMENVFRYSLRTLLEANAARSPAGQYTLLDVNPLLTNGPFRMEVLRAIRDRDIHRYWLEIYANLARNFRDEMIMPVQNKIDRFNQQVLRNVVGQRETTLSLAALLERNAPLIVDTAAGLIGADNAGLIGATLLDLVACRLRERGEGHGKLVVIVDEFQQTPADWATMLEGLRKYGAVCVLATQSLAALERSQPGLRGAVFGNLGTVVSFGTSAEDARYLVPELNEDVEVADLINLPVRNAYIRSTDGASRLPVFSVEVPLPPTGDPAVAAAVAAHTAQSCGRDRLMVEAERQAFLEALYRPDQGRPAPGNPVPAAPPPPPATSPQSGQSAPGGASKQAVAKRVRSKNRRPGKAAAGGEVPS